MSNPNIAKDSPTTFKPGQSGNPKGKKKGTLSMTTKLKEAITKISEGNEEPDDVIIVKKVLEKAKAGDERMINLIWNYIDGKPLQQIENKVTGDLTINLTQYGDKNSV